MSKVLIIILVMLMAGFLEGCTLPGTLYHAFHSYTYKSPLSEQDTAASREEGTATISGEVSFKLRNGKIAHGEESLVYLIPVSAYTTEWFEHYLVRDHRIIGLDPRAFLVTRATVVGSDGRFQFSNIPAGNYYISCTVTPNLPPYQFLWATIPRPSIDDSVKAYATVTVGAGERVKVTVTRP